MAKAITKSDDYEFTLSDELKEMSETELRETSATRDFALQAVREWIEANPRIAASRMGKLTTSFLWDAVRMECASVYFLFLTFSHPFRCQLFAPIFAGEKVQCANHL